jgi:ribonucleotide monophosphatase NagD (HAD superfamily)
MKAGMAELLTYCFDIDGTICSITDGEYADAEPFPERISHIRQLFESGHRIVLFTARGSTTGIDWSKVTKDQMKAWGVPHHELRFGKPFADIFVDDKAINDKMYNWKSH